MKVELTILYEHNINLNIVPESEIEEIALKAWSEKYNVTPEQGCLSTITMTRFLNE